MQVPPKSILFDLDGTLFDREASVRELIQEQHRSFGPALAHIPRETYVQRVLDLGAHGYVDVPSREIRGLDQLVQLLV